MTGNGNIPFLDLVTPHLELEEELVSVFRTALKSAGFVGGRMVEDFEREFAEFCGVQYCIGVGSGTDALRFALIAAGVQPGDTVVTVPNTFIATTEAISQAGARPDFVEIEERTYNMDPRRLQEYLETRCYLDRATGKLLNQKTRRPVTAIVPVHLYGQPADMDPVLELADRHNLIVIEDACQAHGAEYFSSKQNRWMRAGSMGRAASFSFYPGKNLGACGEAGAVTTNDRALAERVRMLRDHGQVRKYHHDSEGYNGRLDAIQAGVLRVKLHHLAKWNEQRRERARGYDELFANTEGMVILPHVPAWSRPVYHLYVVRVVDRERLQKDLAAEGIATGIHYPIPLHLAKAYAHLGYREGDFPVSERVATQILSLPMYPQLELRQQRRIVQKVLESLSIRRDGQLRSDLQPATSVLAPRSTAIPHDRGKIWIDLDNSPHVPFFTPIIEELQKRGYSIALTARDCFQVRELADLFHLNYKLIGRHSGKNKIRKMAGLGFRALQLIPTVLTEKPDLAVSVCSRSQLIVSTSLGIPSLFIGDYEFATGWVLMRPTWLLCPEVIPKAAVRCPPNRILKYPGIKEDVYVPRFVPDPRIRPQLGLQEQDLVVTLRPPASEAHYHSAESDELFEAAIEFLSKKPDVKLVALPRNERQAICLKKSWPGLFTNGKMRIPEHVVDGLNLIWYSDLVISGGGTMNREAAALGVPVYSIFRGKIGAVDQYLSSRGRLVLLKSVRDVQTKILLVPRHRPAAKPQNGAGTALRTVVEQIVAITDSKCPMPERSSQAAEFDGPRPAI
jgi:dTDP-4-amino-4,6-dideoxygalactose transaminase/predicted glycosyltransferase